MRIRLFWLTCCLCLGLAGTALALGGVEDVLPGLSVAPANVGGFYTPIAYHKGAVYLIDVELPAGPQNAINLETVVRKGVKQGNAYVWTKTVVENRTIDDPYHALGSIAVDKDGYIHVAYNMHNMPWQYAVSARPEDISAFRFLGEPLTLSEISAVRHENQTPFPYVGQAAIPGSQVTYPAFFYDRHQDLYVTYRFALRPRRSFFDREYGGGIARYDVRTRTWTAIGQTVALAPADADIRRAGQARAATPFATNKGMWVNDPRLWFDAKNGMHVAWSWADYTRFAVSGSPEPTFAYAYSPDGRRFFRADGTAYTLPIGFAESDLCVRGRGYGGTPHVVLTQGGGGAPLIMLTPPGKPYHYVIYDAAARRWSSPMPTPYGAHAVYVEDTGVAWLFATGPVILTTRTPQNPNSWRVVYKESQDWGNIKLLALPGGHSLLAYMTRIENFRPAPDRRSPTAGTGRVRIVHIDLDKLRK